MVQLFAWKQCRF